MLCTMVPVLWEDEGCSQAEHTYPHRNISTSESTVKRQGRQGGCMLASTLKQGVPGGFLVHEGDAAVQNTRTRVHNGQRDLPIRVAHHVQ